MFLPKNVVVPGFGYYRYRLFVQKLHDEHPETFAPLTGFTWYRNSVGSMITRYGIPSLVFLKIEFGQNNLLVILFKIGQIIIII